MKALAPILLAIASFLMVWLFLGCSSMTDDQKAKWGATGSFLAQKAMQIAGNVILSAATSSQDAGHKADWLDSAAAGLRTEVSISSDDVSRLVQIWTPERNHWTTLAENLAKAYEDAPGSPAQKAEALARGLNEAAEKLRSETAVRDTGP